MQQSGFTKVFILFLLLFACNLTVFGDDAFKITNYRVDIDVEKNGSFIVTEHIDVHFFEKRRGIIRSIPFRYKKLDSVSGEKAIKPQYDDYYLMYIKDVQVDSLNFRVSTVGDEIQVRIGSADKYITGDQSYVIRYKVWGALNQFKNHVELPWNFIGHQWDVPIEKASVYVHLPEKVNINRDDVLVFTGAYGSRESNATYTIGDTTIVARLTQPLPKKHGASIAIRLPNQFFDNVQVPFEVIADNFVIKNFETKLAIAPDGMLRVKKKFDIKLLQRITRYRLRFYYRFNKSSFFLSSDTSTYLPDWSLFKGDYNYWIYLDTATIGVSTYNTENILEYKWQLPRKFEQDTTINLMLQCRVFDVLCPQDDNYILYFPVLNYGSEPIERGKLTVEFPEGVKESDISYQLYNDREIVDISKNPTTFRNHTLTVFIPKQLKSYKKIHVKIQFPKKYVSKSELRVLALIAYNNPLYVVVVIVFVFLLLMWLLFGRDKKSTVVVQYLPPKDITPAEAGLLWDDKLHKRDLIALIYYWAGNGLIEISEHGEDYELTKLKELPEDAKSFEKTMFSRLFKSKDTVSVSSMRNSFYYTLKTANKQLESYASRHKFYVPGTRGFARFLRVMGIIFAIPAAVLIVVFIFISGGYLGVLRYFVFFISLALILYLFGRIMSKKQHFGKKQYTKILGFKKFIEKAELPRLKELVDEYPDYFERTISYAIVLGLWNKWAEKFQPLLTEPPNWYHAQDSQASFNTSLFTNRIVSSMHKMEEDFTYKYTPSSSSGSSWSSGSSSSWSSSSSSSSSSSWSSSGGSSFSSGGGYSGGGYGGGGGSSW